MGYSYYNNYHSTHGSGLNHEDKQLDMPLILRGTILDKEAQYNIIHFNVAYFNMMYLLDHPIMVNNTMIDFDTNFQCESLFRFSNRQQREFYDSGIFRDIFNYFDENNSFGSTKFMMNYFERLYAVNKYSKHIFSQDYSYFRKVLEIVSHYSLVFFGQPVNGFLLHTIHSLVVGKNNQIVDYLFTEFLDNNSYIVKELEMCKTESGLLDVFENFESAWTKTKSKSLSLDNLRFQRLFNFCFVNVICKFSNIQPESDMILKYMKDNSFRFTNVSDLIDTFMSSIKTIVMFFNPDHKFKVIQPGIKFNMMYTWLVYYEYKISDIDFKHVSISDDIDLDTFDFDDHSHRCVNMHLYERVYLEFRKLSNILYAMKLPSGVYTDISRKVSDVMQKYERQFDKNVASKIKRKPFVLCLYGGSSIGKTSLIQNITTQVMTQGLGLSNFDFGRDSWFYSSSKYNSGLKNSHKVVHFDDAAVQSKVIKEIPADLQLFMDIAGPAPVQSNQAALEDKGKIYFQPDFITLSTNTKELNSSSYFSCPAAFLRRIDYMVTVKVKPEFLLKDFKGRNTGQLDAIKCKQFCDQNGYRDFWNFSVERVVLEQHSWNTVQQSRFEIMEDEFGNVLHDISYNELVSFLCRHIEKKNIVEEDVYRQIVESQPCPNHPYWNLMAGECKYCSYNMENSSFLTDNSNKSSKSLPVSFDCEDNISIKSVQTEADSGKHKYFHSFLGCFSYLCGGVFAGSVFYFSYLLKRVKTAFNYYQSLEDYINYNKKRFEKYYRYILLIPAMYASYKVYSSIKGIGNDIDFVSEATNNIWYKDEKATKSSLYKNYVSTNTSIQTIMKHNLQAKMCIIDSNDNKSENYYSVHIQGIYSHIYALPYHVIDQLSQGNKDVRIYVEVVGDPDVSSSNLDFRYKQCGILMLKDIYKEDAHDICYANIAWLRNVGSKPLVLLPDVIDHYSRSTLKFVKVHDIQTCSVGKFEKYYKFKDIVDVEWSNFLYIMGVKSQIGDCGYIYFYITPEGDIPIAMHVGKDKPTGITLAELFDKSIINNAIEHFSNVSDLIIESETCKNYSFSPFHVRSFVNWLPQYENVLNKPIKCFEAYGTLNEYFRRSYTSKGIHIDIFEDIFNKTNMLPDVRLYTPHMGKPYNLGNECYKGNPFAFNVVYSMSQSRLYSIHDFTKCIDQYFEHTKSTYLHLQLSPLTYRESINGIKGKDYVDPIKLNTSMGFPISKPKRIYIDLEQDADGMYRIFKDESGVYEAFNDYDNILRDGCNLAPMINACLKDEFVSKKKVTTMLTRVFTCLPVIINLLIRKYYLPIVAIIQTNIKHFHIAVGTNCYSSDWLKCYEIITKFGDQTIFAGDYSKYDKVLPGEVIMSSLKYLEKIAKCCGYSDADLRAMRSLAEDIVFPIINLNGDVIRLYGSLTSGNSLTIIIGSICNIFLLMEAYYKLGLKDFFLNVSPLVYGDDNVVNVSERVSDKFNHTLYSQYLFNKGIIYTMPDKKSETRPFLNLNEITFLKRRFVKVGHEIVCPIELETISKMLRHMIPSKELTKSQHLGEIVNNAIREFFLNCYSIDNIDLYNQFYSHIENICKFRRIPFNSDSNKYHNLVLFYINNYYPNSSLFDNDDPQEDFVKRIGEDLVIRSL